MLLPENGIIERVQNSIFRRYQANSGATIYHIYDLDDKFFVIERDLLTFIKREREAILQAVQAELHSHHAPDEQALMGTFLQMTRKFVYQSNQFVTLAAADQAQLVATYSAFAVDIARILRKDRAIGDTEQLLHMALKKHFLSLRTFLLSLNQTFEYLDTQVVCREYGPRFQLAVLGIDEQALKEPILDLGCGEQGHLVNYLRGFGLEAFGIDRLVAQSSHLIKADWLHFDFQEASWGTIISHMAFSNHFIFQHSYRKGVPEVYAAQLMKFLSSLKPLGMMCYAPGLPFIEPLLPTARYRVTKHALNIPNLTGHSLSGNTAQLLNDAALYATRITKLKA